MCNLWERKGSCSILVLTGSGSRSWAASLCCAHKNSKINLINGTNFHQIFIRDFISLLLRSAGGSLSVYILRASYSEAAIVLLRYPIQEKMVLLAARYPAKGYFIPDLKYASKARNPSPPPPTKLPHVSAFSIRYLSFMVVPILVETGRYWPKLTNNNHNSR